MAALYPKDPNAVLDYYVDWSAWLGSDSIVVSTWAKVGDITLGSGIDLGPVQGVWVSGGTVATNAVLTNHILTVEGRVDDRSIILVLKEQ
jgi:hypothetical protein